jgi:urea transporter
MSEDCGLLRHIVWFKITDVSEVHAASIIALILAIGLLRQLLHSAVTKGLWGFHNIVLYIFMLFTLEDKRCIIIIIVLVRIVK